MSDITERVQRIIEEKLGVDASEVKPEATDVYKRQCRSIRQTIPKMICWHSIPLPVVFQSISSSLWTMDVRVWKAWLISCCNPIHPF